MSISDSIKVPDKKEGSPAAGGRAKTHQFDMIKCEGCCRSYFAQRYHQHAKHCKKVPRLQLRINIEPTRSFVNQSLDMSRSHAYASIDNTPGRKLLGSRLNRQHDKSVD